MNEGYTYRERLPRRAEGLRLDAYLAARYDHSSIEQWRARIAEGRVTLDGDRAAPDRILRTGERLAWHRPPWREPDAPLDFDVLFDEHDVLVVDKPAGLPTLPGGGFLQHTLAHRLGSAAPIHRLGRFTSGAVLCARTPAMRAALATQFEARTIVKRYRALAAGEATNDRFTIDAPIGPVPYPPLGRLHAASPDGKPSLSEVTVLERRAGSFLCDVAIESGRPHQIRIHLAFAGHPLVGDPLYRPGGLPDPDGTAVPGDPGYLLHSAEIGFEIPGVGRRRVLAPAPAALRR